MVCSPLQGLQAQSAGIEEADSSLIPEVDSAGIENAVAEARDITSLRSLLIQQDGKLITERYFRSGTSNRAMNTKSASKSIISLLTGIAVDKGYIGSVEDRVSKYLPEYFESISDSAKHRITIKNLLTMQTGLETTSFYNYGAWVNSDDWVSFALNQPMDDRPGGDMRYSTGTSHLLSVIITKASGMSTRAFAEKYLFGPLNIQAGGWDRDPQGYYMGGNNLALTPEAMLKLGQMVLNGGTWNGDRIISKEWLADSFKTYTRSNYNPYDYGYMWWNRKVAGYDTYFAWGYGGQYIFIIPELQGVVVMMSSLANATQDRSYKEPVFDLLADEIIGGVLEKYPGTR
ncbi:serine hydrolase [Balneolaceae bacterium YR4-1]|uniref:Serine hydrolase n=1 Tax=Halalkalibaculum roseum TaxID=2709311 RepID=A0A6M1SWL1_9BACT|nr:serine hydrolase [Halalkalibaculum roseum]NGP75434.1 serine hydrolase [Halalkalibaculum roseum]